MRSLLLAVVLFALAVPVAARAQLVAPPPPPLALTFDASFASPSTDLSGSVDGSLPCHIPCTVKVVPGWHQVQISGGEHFSEQKLFPAAPITVTVVKRWDGYYNGMAKTGFGLGIAHGATALAAMGFGAFLYASDKYTTCHSDACGLGQGFGAIFMVSSAASMVVGGVLMGVVGGVGLKRSYENRIRIDGEQPTAKPLPITLLDVGVAPVRGGAMVGATFSF